MHKNIALFQYPDSNQVHILSSDTLEMLAVDQLHARSGFVIHPFDPQESCYLIAADHYEVVSNEQLPTSLPFHFSSNATYTSTQSEDYVAYVENGIKEIKKGIFRKVVPARIKVKSREGNPLEAFAKACKKYPRAFVSLISTEKFGTWMGASPELLLKSDGHLMQTVALAGTQPANGKHPSESVWTQKEIEEQALVSRYIINCFKQIRLREFLEEGPKTIQAGDLLHLKTTYKIHLNEVEYDDLAGTLINLLHPTSATCGMPKEPSLAFICQHEPFERGLYTGYIGPVNLQQRTDVYVHLRCTQLLEHQLVLYAGAGITEDSSPEKEWLETEHKCRIMEQLF